MPIICCRFHVILPGDRPRPMLPVRIWNPTTGQSVRAWGLVDTGADDCALPASLANSLGHRLTAGTLRVIGTGNGATTAYAHTTRIDIFARLPRSRRSKPKLTIPNTLINFLPNLGCVLLGTTTFLSRLILEVNYPRQFLVVRTP